MPIVAVEASVSEHGGQPEQPLIPTDLLQFPDAARLELDHAIEVLVHHAQTVRNAQGRLRALLRANHLVASHVDLPDVLRHVVDAAKDQQHRLFTVVRKLDQIVRDIRGTIFDLHSQPAPGETAAPSLRRTLTEIVRTTTDSLGFTPALRLDGPLDTFVPPTIATDLSAVVREALSNTARHARAATATVQITATPTTLIARIEDDGRGIGDTTRRSGLANLRARAEKHSGTLTIDSAPEHGTTLTWTVPLPQNDQTM